MHKLLHQNMKSKLWMLSRIYCSLSSYISQDARPYKRILHYRKLIINHKPHRCLLLRSRWDFVASEEVFDMFCMFMYIILVLHFKTQSWHTRSCTYQHSFLIDLDFRTLCGSYHYHIDKLDCGMRESVTVPGWALV